MAEDKKAAADADTEAKAAAEKEAADAKAAEEKAAAEKAEAEAAAAAAAPASSGKKPKVTKDKALGIERFNCSEGDFSSLEDAARVERHIAEAHG